MAELLLVDDEPGIREGVAAVLRLRGHRVRSAGAAAEALASGPGPDLDLLLTDFKLPDGDGLTLARQFRRVRPGLPVLLMTGHASESLRQAFAELGEALLVEKPVRPAEVARAVEALLARGAGRPAPDSGLARLAPEERVHVAARLLGACQDTCDRLSLAAYAATLCGGTPRITLSDEGGVLRVEASWPADGPRPALERAAWILERLGGDVQADRGGLRVGFGRDGASTDGVDLDRFRPATPAELAATAAGPGPFRNAAPWLRLLFELSEGRAFAAGRTRERGLPEDLATLWR